MIRFYSILYGFILLSACFFTADGLEQDFFPLAIGNWWEFKTRTQETERWEITGIDSNAFILTRDYQEQGYTRSSYLRPADDNGWINRPCGRELGCWWAPQAMLPGTATLVTPWGTVENTRRVLVVWGHPSGGNWSCITASGIGVVAWCWASHGMFDTAALLTDYHLETVPATRSHSVTGTAQADTGIQTTWTGGTTAEVSAFCTGPSDAQWYAVSSYNPLTRSVRIYLADTASHPSNGNSALEPYNHLFTIEHLDPDSLYRFKMYRVTYFPVPDYTDLYGDSTSTGYDSIQSTLLYDRPLIAGKVSARTPKHYSVRESGFTVSGGTVTIYNGPPGTRAPLSCILFSVDGRCIVRCRIGERRSNMSIITPGAGVYLLRIRNGNGSCRMLRFIIAQ